MIERHDSDRTHRGHDSSTDSGDEIGDIGRSRLWRRDDEHFGMWQQLLQNCVPSWKPK